MSRDHLPTAERISHLDMADAGRREFENAMHLRKLAGRRFDAAGRTLGMVQVTEALQAVAEDRLSRMKPTVNAKTSKRAMPTPGLLSGSRSRDPSKAADRILERSGWGTSKWSDALAERLIRESVTKPATAAEVKRFVLGSAKTRKPTMRKR